MAGGVPSTPRRRGWGTGAGRTGGTTRCTTVSSRPQKSGTLLPQTRPPVRPTLPTPVHLDPPTNPLELGSRPTWLGPTSTVTGVEGKSR